MSSPTAAPPIGYGPNSATISPSKLLRELARVDAAQPTARKLLIGPDVNFGRELLMALGRSNGAGWIGWEPTTIRRVAEELAFVRLSELELRVATDVETAALAQEALGAVASAATTSASFRALATMLGFRRAVRDALLELRTAGVVPDELRSAARVGSPAHDLAAVLAEYERRLDSARLCDPAGVFVHALAAFDDEAPFVLPPVVLVAASLTTRGLPGRLLMRLLDAGARVVHGDEPDDAQLPGHIVGALDGQPRMNAEERGNGAPRPAAFFRVHPRSPDGVAEQRRQSAESVLDFFAAASPALELREVLRRAAAEGVRWDEIEIVTTDPDEYGVALDSLCQQLDAGCTMLSGVPLRCTRVGRALDRWLGWLSDGLPADALREALEAGELGADDAAFPPAALGRELRRLAIGWGRARYEAALARLAPDAVAADVRRREGEGDEELERRRADRVARAGALAGLLRALLAVTPPVLERGSTAPVRTTCAALARATLGWLDLVPVHGPAERLTIDRLRVRLGRLAEVDEAAEPFGVAMAALRDGLADLRAWPRLTHDSKPWAASGGILHLTDVAHAGATGRRRTFVVGLDAERTAGARLQDPLLTDGVRAALGDALATTADRRAHYAWTLAGALAGLRGRVTLSWSVAGADGRETGPAPELLQAFRRETGRPALSYREMRAELPPVACAVPVDPDGCVDSRDAWLGALADGPLLLDGEAAVRAAFPALDAGLVAHDVALGDEPTAHHGVVGRSATLDLERLTGAALSPSALETLAKCPLSWLYRYGASLRTPDDPEYDPDAWLGSLERGALLHDVYDRFVTEYRERRAEIAQEAARVRLLAIVDEEIARWEATLPPPSRAVLEAECDELRASAIAFLEMERSALAAGDDGQWAATELEFGFDGHPVLLELGDGVTLSLKGRIDRVDVLRDGALRVVDYKTGSPAPFRDRVKHGPFHGGRHLQAALYAHAVTQMPEFAGKRVARFEYRFPTQRGQNEIVRYDPDELSQAMPIVRGLLDHVTRGEFPPTTDAGDCTFCEYQPVCRARRTKHGCESPRAAWAASHDALPPLEPMAARRRPAGDA